IQKESAQGCVSETFEYDSQNRVINYIDALGRETQTFYNEHSKHPLGDQTVLQKTIVSPSKVSLVETNDAFDRVIKTEYMSPDNEIISASSRDYDACGNLCLHHQHVYEGINYTGTQITEYTYDSLNRLKSFTRANGT